MVFNKKAISPVVATALLLVVAVVAVVGFQGWYTNYQSDILAKTNDQTSASAANIAISYVKGGITAAEDIYITNNGGSSITGFSMSYNSSDCNISSPTLNPGLNSLTYDATTCNFSSLSSAEVLLKTSDSVQPLSIIIS